MASQSRLAYLAGIIDGEGCIAIETKRDYKTKTRYHYLRITVRMKSRKAVKLLHDTFGGRFWYGTNGRKINNYYLYSWVVTNNKARDCLVLLQPYLLVKLDQCELALDFHRDCILNRKWGPDGNTLPKEEVETRETYKKQMSALKVV